MKKQFVSGIFLLMLFSSIVGSARALNREADKKYADKVAKIERGIATTLTTAVIPILPSKGSWFSRIGKWVSGKVAAAVCVGGEVGVGIGSIYWEVHAADPPSPNFTEVFQPRSRNLTAFYNTLNITEEAWSFPELSAILNFTEDAIKTAEFQEALTITLERHASAVTSGDIDAIRLQSSAIIDYGNDLISLLSEMKTSASTLDPLWNDFWTLNNVTITASNITLLQQEVAQNGLPPSEQEGFKVLLATDTEIQQFTSELLAIDPVLAAQTTPINLTITIGDMSPLYNLVEQARFYLGVGGLVIQVDKLSLLAPYFGLASTILVAAVASAIYVKRVKHRKDKQ